MKRHAASHRPPAFRDRIDAGAQLAERLRLQPEIAAIPVADLVVIGLVRGGVVVAAEVARRLGARLEAMVVRKLGAPGQPELAIGALSANMARVLNRPLIEDLDLTQHDIERITERARDAALDLADDLGIPTHLPDLAGKTAILVDDGLATGATMRVAIDTAYSQGSAHVIVAVPVAPMSMLDPFRSVSDGVVTVIATDQLSAVGRWYQLFDDVPTSAVREIVQSAHHADEM
jgi:putative phosphoribosyl transferase